MTRSLLDVRQGSRNPTQLHLPQGIVSADAAQEVIDLADSVGLILDPWQCDTLRGACGERPGGTWAAFLAYLEVARQDGKGAVLEARQLGGLYLFGDRLQMHSAHEFKTASEHFLRVRNLIEGSDDLRKKTHKPRIANDEPGITTRAGCRLRFIARKSGVSGRGLSGDTVYLDEAFAVTLAMMGALLPTLSARPNPQLWVSSSAPHFTSDYLHALRRRVRAALEGESTEPRLFAALWFNPPNTPLDDREAWARANPALGIRISEEFIEDELRELCSTPEGVAEFQRERLGIAEGGDGESGFVDYPQWAGLADSRSSVASRRCIGLSVAPDGAWSSFSMAGRRADGLTHVETLERREGTGWVVEKAAELAVKLSGPIRVNPAAPEGALIKQMRERRVPVELVQGMEYAQTCEAFAGMVRDGSVRHLNQDTLNRSVAAAGRVSYGKDLWVWARPSSVDISPLTACTLALTGVSGVAPVSYAPRRLR